MKHIIKDSAIDGRRTSSGFLYLVNEKGVPIVAVQILAEVGASVQVNTRVTVNKKKQSLRIPLVLEEVCSLLLAHESRDRQNVCWPWLHKFSCSVAVCMIVSLYA